MKIRTREIGAVISCLPLKEAVPVITQGDVYCDMSVTLQTHVQLLITVIIFFQANFVSCQMSSLTARLKTLIMCGGLSNIIVFRLQESKQQMTKQTLWRAHIAVLSYSFSHVM